MPPSPWKNLNTPGHRKCHLTSQAGSPAAEIARSYEWSPSFDSLDPETSLAERAPPMSHPASRPCERLDLPIKPRPPRQRYACPAIAANSAKYKRQERCPSHDGLSESDGESYTVGWTGDQGLGLVPVPTGRIRVRGFPAESIGLDGTGALHQ